MTKHIHIHVGSKVTDAMGFNQLESSGRRIESLLKKALNHIAEEEAFEARACFRDIADIARNASSR